MGDVVRIGSRASKLARAQGWQWLAPLADRFPHVTKTQYNGHPLHARAGHFPTRNVRTAFHAAVVGSLLDDRRLPKASGAGSGGGGVGDGGAVAGGGDVEEGGFSCASMVRFQCSLVAVQSAP